MTDFISLNKRMSNMSATMGKEQNMAESSYRKYQAAAQINMSAFPLTSLKEETNLAVPAANFQ